MPESSPAPATLGHYRLISLLGEGGMGQVYLATDTRLERNVAIKLLPPSASGDEAAQQRMLREARMVATIDHPNVCTIYEIGTAGEQPYIVMQYIQGETLGDRMRRSVLSLEETVDIARQITAALAEAHGRGIVHRDIKPGNIMISSTGVVKVLDFGLATSFLRDANEATAVALTSPGLIVGTAPYMSPEQLRAEQLDGRSDLFSLGIVLYQIATGNRPFDRNTAMGTISAILSEDPPPLRASDLTPLEPIILRALAKRAERRFQSAAEMHEALGSVKKRRRAKPRLAVGSQDLPTQVTAIPQAAERAASSSRTRVSRTTPSTRETSSRKRSVRVHVPDPEAEKLYLRGRAQWNKRHPEAIRQAIALFHETVDLDPLHASAYAGLADAYLMLGFLQVIPPRDVLPKGRASALRAIELAPEHGEPHASLGYMAGLFDWDWDTAHRELHAAMKLNPHYALAPHWYGVIAASKALDESLHYVSLARDLDPLSPIIHTAIGIAHHFRRDYPAALRTYRQVLDAEVAFAPAHYYIALTYEQLGKYEEATQNFSRATEIAGRGWLFLGALGHCYGVSGQHELARRLLQDLDVQQHERYVSAFNVMLIHLGLGEIDAAMSWLERALEERASALWHTPVEPRFDVIRQHPRFRELVAQYGLDPEYSAR